VDEGEVVSMTGRDVSAHRTAFEHAQVGLAVVTAGGDVESANDYMTGILGGAPETLASFPASVREARKQADGPGPTGPVQVLTGGMRWSVLRAGERYVVQAQPLGDARPFDDDTVATDGRLAAIVELHHDLASGSFDVDDIVQWLVHRSRVLFGDSEATLGLLDGDSIVYKVALGGRRGLLVDNRVALTDSISGTCIRTGTTMVSDDVELDPRADVAACRRAGLRSMVLVPLRHRGRTVGVLNVNSPSPYAYSPSDIATVELVGGVVSVAYSHAADLAGKRELLGELQRTVSALQETQDQLLHDALHDPLTQLPNRVLFLDRLRQALAASRRTSEPVAVLFVDVDRFKVVNDSLGHEAGDVLLRAVADGLSECVRAGDTAARFGGDEFTVLCTGTDQADDAVAVAHRIAARLGRRVHLPGGEVFPTISVGVARSSGSSDSAEDLLDRADLALYQAKRGGRNRVEVHEGRMQRGAHSRLALENDLRRAVARDELVLAYQPQYSSTSRTVVGVEALLRWRHPERGLLQPDGFLDIAEETGLILPMGRWVLEEACRQARRWRDLAGRAIPVAVNLSRRQLDDPELVDIVEQALAAAGIEGSQLSLEILEDVLVDDGSRCQRNLLALHERGVRLDVDDFGIGYSSLAQITKFPVANLKVDKSLVDRVETEDAVVVAVVHMAHALGITVVAEGVETAGQELALRRIGCDSLQGFLLSPPCSTEEVDGLLSRELQSSAATV
jgi:diguanylate cyclase (GGDEF)-like protein